ncbi:hypothetical protein [Paucilactobacillus kaifaensis]|uniref:hypothetical protein n=1 Tax=Paucilactobacillus kaifaensis TaxID=2559921 RepID=UPI0010F84AC2|nr:hypothetical protein [Paucilactobacillus kaifaensis]
MDKEKVLNNLQKKDPYNVSVEKVILVITRKGDGSQNNPVRLVDHYYRYDTAELIFEIEH